MATVISVPKKPDVGHQHSWSPSVPSPLSLYICPVWVIPPVLIIGVHSVQLIIYTSPMIIPRSGKLLIQSSRSNESLSKINLTSYCLQLSHSPWKKLLLKLQDTRKKIPIKPYKMWGRSYSSGKTRNHFTTHRRICILRLINPYTFGSSCYPD